MATFIVGIAISVFGSVASNFGVNVQKFSQIKNKARPKEERRPYFMQLLWWLGLVFVIAGALCDFASLSFAPQSVVMPVGSLTLVANVIFAHFWLGEALGVTDLVGTSFIVSGAVIIAVAYGALGDLGEDKYYGARDLQELYHRWIVFGYGMSILILLASFLWILRRCEILVKNGRSSSPEYQGLLARLHPISYAASAGIFGSFSVTFGKSIGELMRATSDDKVSNQLEEPLTYVFLICMVATILLQTHFLAQGLEFFDALFIVPVFQCFFIVLSILGGALYWDEMSGFNAAQWCLFPLGVLITIFGVYLMSSRDMHVDDEDEGKGDVQKDESGVDVTVVTDDDAVEKIQKRRSRVGTFHNVIDKTLEPFTLLDQPVLKKDGLSHGIGPRGRKSTMVSRTGAFFPLMMDHSTGSLSRSRDLTVWNPITYLHEITQTLHDGSRPHSPRARRQTFGGRTNRTIETEMAKSPHLVLRNSPTLERQLSPGPDSDDGDNRSLSPTSRFASRSLPMIRSAMNNSGEFMSRTITSPSGDFVPSSSSSKKDEDDDAVVVSLGEQ